MTTSEIRELIEQNSRKPLVEQLSVPAYLKFADEEYGQKCCEEHCPHRYAEYDWECPGGCRAWNDGVKRGERIINGGDMLISEILHTEDSALVGSSLNEPIDFDGGRYAWLNWEDMYDSEFCTSCKRYGKPECPEDIFSVECAKRHEAIAMERVSECVNEVLKWE